MTDVQQPSILYVLSIRKKKLLHCKSKCQLFYQYFSNFSILDQQQKQAIPFQGGVVLSDYDGRIFVASTKEIYSLVPVAWEKQVSL